MLSIKRHIPNAITCLNLLAGCFSVKYAFEGDYTMVLYLTFAAALFDFLDGFAARLLKAYSEIGKQLDSLADMISFGFVPAITVYTFLTSWLNSFEQYAPAWDCLPYLGFLIAIASALRLAKFNVDTRQTVNFIGMPTPANALLWVPLIYSLSSYPLLIPLEFGYVMAIIITTTSYLLISEIPMLSLKFKTLSFNLPNSIRIFFLAITLLLTLLFGMLGISLGIVCYIIFSIIIDIIERFSN